jgi:hypothetical protein
MAEQRQRFVGNIERQLGLTRRAGLFLTLDTLYQQHDKADADAPESSEYRFSRQYPAPDPW